MLLMIHRHGQQTLLQQEISLPLMAQQMDQFNGRALL